MKLKILLLILVLIPSAYAHVGYVVEDELLEQNLGNDFSYLAEALTPFHMFLIILTIALVLALYYYLMRSKIFMSEMNYILEEVKEYSQFVPWIARLGLGIALIGAGTEGVLISSSVVGSEFFSTLQIALGFMILAGFLIGPAVLGALFLYIMALSQNFYVLGNFDFFGLALALLVIEYERPGVDDILGIPSFILPLDRFREYTSIILRSGIGISMMFLAIYEKILNPHISKLVVQDYALTSVIPVSAQMWVLSAGAIEFLVGLALLIGFKTRITSVIGFIVLSSSFFFFQEAVYSHITLFAILSATFVLGNGKLHVDIESPLKRRKRLMKQLNPEDQKNQ